MTLRDYLTVLRHLLQVKGIFPQLPLFSYFGPYIDGKAVNPILKEDSVTALFMPMLPAPALTSLATMLGIPSGAAQHSTGMMLETADFPGRRKKGSGSCRFSYIACIHSAMTDVYQQGVDGPAHLSSLILKLALRPCGGLS
jgi:hypothetical protein